MVHTNTLFHNQACSICVVNHMCCFFNLAHPMTYMTLKTPIIARAQNNKVPVATCLSANGKPPSVIKWDTKLKGQAMFQETRNPNGTVTIRSNYVIVPSRESHRQKLTCIVTYNTEHFSDSGILNVQCKTNCFL